MALVLSKKLVITIAASVVVIVLVIVGYIQFSKSDQARTRDLARLSDMRFIQAEFELIFNNENTFENIATEGCVEGQMLYQCTLFEYIPGIYEIKDPSGFSYKVTQTPTADNYEITFTLEGKAGNLLPGEHTLSRVGIE